MTMLSNDPLNFREEALRGFVGANKDYVQRVHGGVVRRSDSPSGEVAVVLGGGSGHYPAFAGWVGPGLAHGAACGNIFASPSASQVYSVARASDNGGGIVLGFGNYAGDVLHFGQAAERLRAEGTDVRIVAVHDDLASNTIDRQQDRRGIAGDLPVFKIMGAAAAAGFDLNAVVEVAQRANARTRTLGIAFTGCTLPGADHPLFTVPEGQMAIGLGIHGEPGIETRPRGSAAEVADLLVDGALGEEPSRTADGYQGRVAILLNGLGASKYDELFVVFDRVLERLDAAGLEIVQPEVGEHVTSLDMAGLSLTITYLDDELERLWTAPVNTPAYRRGSLDQSRPERVVAKEVESATIEPGSPASQGLAAELTQGLAKMAELLDKQEVHLGNLDAVAGDGDHGQGMVLGSSAALSAAQDAVAGGAGASTLLIRAGGAWAEGAGGTSGALWGAAIASVGSVLSDQNGATQAEAVEAVLRAVETVQRLGGAQQGDKTMVDALIPFATAMQDADQQDSLAAVWDTAVRAAQAGAEGTAELTANLGRSRTHGDKSLGTPDPGAVSFAMIVAELGLLIRNHA